VLLFEVINKSSEPKHYVQMCFTCANFLRKITSSHLRSFKIKDLQRLRGRRLPEVHRSRRRVRPEQLGKSGHVHVVVVVEMTPPTFWDKKIKIIRNTIYYSWIKYIKIIIICLTLKFAIWF
jgi:hypothetical protein